MAKLIGTAGHVDHGKTTLIQALTGIDTDRLPDEKRRGMTIDIGFAHIELPRSGRVSIVDVPGHERLVTNMLVGAMAVDVVLLCVAADESVMPQTREHLRIVDLLPVQRVVVALTRADLADADIRELSRQEVAELLAETRFAGAPIVAVSSRTGEGLAELRTALDEALQSEHPDDEGPWYLPIDRVFTLKGQGVVATGTLARGRVKSGEEVEIQPEGLKARIRSLHWHHEARPEAERGRRTAMNLTGVRLEDLHRGQIAGRPGTVFASNVVDARLRFAADLRHAARVRVSIGADEVIGKAFKSDSDPDIVQLRLERQVGCTAGQPLIVRQYSPPVILGGGYIVVPQARRRRKGEAAVFTERAAADPQSILDLAAARPEGIDTAEVCRILGRSPQALGDLFESLLESGQLHGFAGLWMTPSQFDQTAERLVAALQDLHGAHPQLSAIPREQVLRKAGLSWSGKPLERILTRLAEIGRIELQGNGLRLAGHAVQLSPKQEAFLARVEHALVEEGINVPSTEDLARKLAVPPQAVAEILRLGVEAKRIVRVDEGLHYPKATIDALIADMREAFGQQPFTAADCRTRWNSSRKYVIPLLEMLDARGLTVRTGDTRVLRSGG